MSMAESLYHVWKCAPSDESRLVQFLDAAEATFVRVAVPSGASAYPGYLFVGAEEVPPVAFEHYARRLVSSGRLAEVTESDVSEAVEFASRQPGSGYSGFAHFIQQHGIDAVFPTPHLVSALMVAHKLRGRHGSYSYRT